MDSTTTEIRAVVESLAGPIIEKALAARPDNGNGYGLALTAFLIFGVAAFAAVVFIYNRQSIATAAHISALNKHIKEQAVAAEKIQAIEARLNQHSQQGSERLYQLQLDEIGKRDATRQHIVDLLDKEFDILRNAMDTRFRGVESGVSALQNAFNGIDKAFSVMQATLSKNAPPKEGG